MSATCVCKNPAPAGEGEGEHCTKCGAWTSAAIDAHYTRKEREGAAVRCEFCGSRRHALAACTLNGARSYRAEMLANVPSTTEG